MNHNPNPSFNESPSSLPGHSPVQAGSGAPSPIIVKERRQKKIIYLFFGLVILAVVLLLAMGIRQAILERRPLSSNIEMELTDEERAIKEQEVADALDAIAENPEDFSSYTALALAYEDLGNYVGAEKTYKKMNELSPLNFLSFSNLGNLYRRQQLYEAAEEMYLRTIANAPRKTDLTRPLVDLYTYNLPEKKSEIPKILEKGLAEVPNSVELLRQLAAFYRQEGPKEKAIEIYERLLPLDQDNETARKEYQQLINTD